MLSEKKGSNSIRDFDRVPIEQVRRFWDARPCNVRHSPKPVGTREYFDGVEARRYFVEPHIVEFADFERWRGKRVLEIGCGIGTDTMGFLRAGALVTAVELSDESLALAKQRTTLYGFAGRVQFYEADAEELDKSVPREPFDLIYSFGVIHHTPHPARVFDQLRGYVTSGSTIKVMMYHTFSWKVLWAVVCFGGGRFWDWRRIIATYSEAQTGCPVTYTYTKRELAKLLEDRGFRVTEMRVEHIFPYRISEYKEYRYRKEWYFQWMPAPLFRWLERNFGWHLCVTAVAR
jgi:2-polyprenyl-3-methyl-5-hydroxy-6-metoxy-1,4-benzoquinol methylase